MRLLLIMALAMLLTVETTGDTGATSATQVQQSKLADEMGKFYRAQYAPAVGPGTSQTETQLQQAKLANELGTFYRQQYAPAAGVSMGGAASMQPASVPMYGAASIPPATQAQEAKRAFDIGSFYRSQYMPANVEAQIQAQQAQQTGLQQGSLPQTPSMQATISEKPASLATVLAAAPQQSSVPALAPAAVPHLAEDCANLTQLKAWYDDKTSSINKYVPKDYQHFSFDLIQKEYEANVKRLNGLPVKQDPSAIASASLAASPPSFGNFRTSFKRKVASWTQGMHDKSDSAADRIAQAAAKAQGKAGRLADDAADAARIVQSGAANTKERLEKLLKQSEHRKGSETLALSAAEPVMTHSKLPRFLACTALVGAIVAVGLELQRTRVSESDGDVYLMHA